MVFSWCPPFFYSCYLAFDRKGGLSFLPWLANYVSMDSGVLIHQVVIPYLKPYHVYFHLWEVYLQDKLLEVRLLGQKVNIAVVLLCIAKFPQKWVYQFAFPSAVPDSAHSPTVLPTEYIITV